ncbi:MAG: DUF1178 family protein [Arenibacterium sp.]
MIQYALKCAEGHRFDSWFQSADAYEKLAARGLVECAVCGGGGVEKAVMTPRVNATSSQTKERPLSVPANPAEQALAEMRKQIETNSDYVGNEFAKQARAMHEGEAPERAIHGEARLDEAKKLVEDGVPVMPLPFLPNRKSN